MLTEGLHGEFVLKMCLHRKLVLTVSLRGEFVLMMCLHGGNWC